MSEGEFLNQSISYLRKEMDGEASTQFEVELQTLETEQKELFERLKESHSVMGDLVPMSVSLEAGDFSPWEAQWLEFARRHEIEDNAVAPRLASLETGIKYWRVAAIAALLVACLSVWSLVSNRSVPLSSGTFQALPTTASVVSLKPGEGDKHNLQASQAFKSGETFSTGIGGRVVLAFSGGATLLAAEDSEVGLMEEGQGGFVSLDHGELVLQGADNFKIPVRTGLGDVILQGNGLVRIVAATGTSGLWVGVAEGEVEFLHQGGNTKVKPGQRFEARGGDGMLVINTLALTPSEVDLIQRLALEAQ